MFADRLKETQRVIVGEIWHAVLSRGVGDRQNSSKENTSGVEGVAQDDGIRVDGGDDISPRSQILGAESAQRTECHRYESRELREMSHPLLKPSASELRVKVLGRVTHKIKIILFFCTGIRVS